jgi:hypothetical protein
MSDMNVKLLEIAKELLILEYTDKKAQDHNRWVIESEKAWRTSRTKLEHPEFPPFPTEAQILDKARSLMTFLENKSKNEVTTEVHNVEPVQEKIVEEVTEKAESVETDEPTKVVVVDSSSEQNVENHTEEIKEQITESTQTEKSKPSEPQSEQITNKGSIPEMKKFNLPENLLAYSRLKVATNLEDRVPSSSRILTNLLDTFKRDKK